MDDSGDVLSPERTAAALAPIIDRLRLAIARRVPGSAQHLLTEFGLTAPAMQTIGMLRNTMPDRAIHRHQLFDVFLYSSPASVTESLDQLTAVGLVCELNGGRLQLSARGRACVAGLHGCMSSIVDELWSDDATLVATLAPLVARAASAAEATGGAAFRVMAPAYEPDGASQAMLLAERLTPLRFHRFDAHAAAWRDAGLTLEDIQALPPGPQRVAIEDETNRRDGAPYSALTPPDRLTLLAGLGALHN